MSLKKNLKIGQASLEYFIIFAVIGGLTLISVSTFLPKARQSGEDLFKAAASRILSNSTTPQITPPPEVPPGGTPLVMGTPSERFQLGAGSEMVFVIDVPAQQGSLALDIYGMSSYTDATFSWTFPDGRVYPDLLGYNNTIMGMSISGSMKLRGTNAHQPNVPDPYIPEGIHVLKIKAIGDSDMMVWVR